MLQGVTEEKIEDYFIFFVAYPGHGGSVVECSPLILEILTGRLKKVKPKCHKLSTALTPGFNLTGPLKFQESGGWSTLGVKYRYRYRYRYFLFGQKSEKNLQSK